MDKQIVAAFIAGCFAIGAALVALAPFWYSIIYIEPESIVHDVTIKTRNRTNAETGSTVTFDVYSGRNHSAFVHSGKGNALERGGVDQAIALIKISETIDRLQISIEEKGSNDGWLPQYVLFKNTETGIETCFYVENDPKYFIGRKVKVASTPLTPTPDRSKCTD